MTKVLSFLVGLMLICVGGAFADVIHLVNGRSITADSYYRENGFVYCVVGEQTIGIPESKVASVDDASSSSQDEKEIFIRMPNYYRVFSLGGYVENGIYEEVYSLEKRCPEYRRVFSPYYLSARNCEKNTGRWEIGKISTRRNGTSRRSTYVLKNVPRGRGANYTGGRWELADGSGPCDLQVESCPPPQTAEEEKLCFRATGFPNDFFNGLYKPFTLINGRIAYRLKSGINEARVYLKPNTSFKNHYEWIMTFDGEVHYHSYPFENPHYLYPHEVQSWNAKGLYSSIYGAVFKKDPSKKYVFTIGR
ncbi:hypothetical protein [Desulfoluna sp.]|uniref:hypothetical protein n=1 Tax=Desulfoluna sp. TaxID=2045199 RepID=UPI00261E6A77|nr:hypothetical protein [Desulfoluna sp.]